MTNRSRIHGALALVAIFAPGAALAKVQPSDTDQVSVEITAKIADRCGISAVGSKQSAMLQMDQAQTHTFNFNVDCNTGFRIGVIAGNGAMRMTGVGAQVRDLNGFAVERAYDVAMNLSTDNTTSINAGTCNSRDLAPGGGKCAFYGSPEANQGFSPGQNEAAANRPGSLTVSWSGDDLVEGRRLAAGTYQDTLTVEIGPRV